MCVKHSWEVRKSRLDKHCQEWHRYSWPCAGEENRLDVVSKLSGFLGLFKGPHAALHLFVYLNGCVLIWISFGLCSPPTHPRHSVCQWHSPVLKEHWPQLFQRALEAFPVCAFTSLLPWQHVTFMVMWHLWVFGEQHFSVHSWREQEEALSMGRMWGRLSLTARETCALSLVFSTQAEVHDRVCWCVLFVLWDTQRVHHPALSPPASVLTWYWKLLWVGILCWVLGTNCCEELDLHMDAFGWI